MVELTLTGKCKDCPYIELDLDYLFENTGRIYFIRCIHDKVCQEEKDG